MSNKEQINTIITTGVTLPPVNPYLDDNASSYGDDVNPPARKKPGRTTANAPKTGFTKTVAPDPKEYIAELERPEDENLF